VDKSVDNLRATAATFDLVTPALGPAKDQPTVKY
jgi:hypothetical protein